MLPSSRKTAGYAIHASIDNIVAFFYRMKRVPNDGQWRDGQAAKCKERAHASATTDVVR